MHMMEGLVEEYPVGIKEEEEAEHLKKEADPEGVHVKEEEEEEAEPSQIKDEEEDLGISYEDEQLESFKKIHKGLEPSRNRLCSQNPAKAEKMKQDGGGDEDSGSSQGSRSNKHRIMAAVRVRWSQSTEERLVELWKAHPSLFDVASKSYHDRRKREKSWEAIAVQLQLPANEVKTRVASLRTQYGKLLKPKPSGSGHKPLTPKQKWILRHLDFLKGHVIHRHTESTLRPAVELDDTFEGEEDSSVLETEAEVEEEESSSPSTCQLVRKQVATKKKPESAQSLEMAKLSLLQQIQRTLASNEDSNELFGQQVASELRNIRDGAVQLRLKRNIMNMIYDALEADRTGPSQYATQLSSPSLYPCQNYPLPSSQPMSFTSMMHHD
ncbi:uncharacterized protein LOC119791263 isoform X2 [Cyprinodon tularosa]|uniref:uncharacterized protein LOC119791263 isoform X2 n=1 Tax=Cyprinodon tularosa TaxID=77115 RepID=UPI0018E24EB9|nr:uncharacterized protein LOC119791263 isoform X2 [Cyprinodon tularosa]